jgi:SAM-dependent methyltransferase
VWFLSRHYENLNARYHGEEGDRFAIEELAPVAARFLPEGGRALEIGCGYGRNLVALGTLPARIVVGCDPSLDELQRARSRVQPGVPPVPLRAPVGLARQEPFRLPFRDGTFDLVVLWQVLEHVFTAEAKRRVLAEAVRVLAPGGHLLVETPNQWFPFDYHDNKFPLVHWIAPTWLRREITYRVRGMRYQPSEYMSLPGYERLLRAAPGVARIERATCVYFASSYAEAWRNLGGTQTALKRVLFVLAAPIHAVLRLFGSSADLVLPSLRIVWRIEKSATAAGTAAPLAGAGSR